MNIFILDRDPGRSARLHCDQHVVKMILESAQILSTVLHGRGIETPYRATHQNHPCVLWADASYDNFRWLIELAHALHEEYRYRFGADRVHGSIRVIEFAETYEFESKGLTPFEQCMPEEYRVQGKPVHAYRAYYRAEKLPFARWTRRPIPRCFRNSASSAGRATKARA
ncbi:MAG: pyrimidine dimer DNA glycosylase/endonuclease V [Planctomycetota bacterium]